MNHKAYFRNTEALYTMRLIVPKVDNVIFESKQKVGTYIVFDSGHYMFRIQFIGYKYNMNNFYAVIAFILVNIFIGCNTYKRKVMLI